MSNQDSVTAWINLLREKDEEAAAKVWERYSVRLLRVARQRLRNSPRRVADEEDVVVRAFDSFFRRVEEGKFPRLNDRDDLWYILVTITERKAWNQVRHQRQLKRGGGRVGGESQIADSSGVPRWDQFSGPEPTPEEAAQVSETMAALLDSLSANLRTVAIYKLEGYTNLEIAAKTDRGVSTVERRLALIRRRWEEHVAR